MRRPRGIVVVLAVAALLALPGSAAAHGTSSYVATVRAIVPPLPGVQARIERGFQIVLTSSSRVPVVVDGPDGRPYLRFTRAGVAANIGGWTLLTPKRTFAWPAPGAVTPRIAPLAVRKEPGKSHHLRDWRIRLRAGGRTYAVVGSLDYRVSDGGLAELLFPFAPMPLLLLFAVGIVRRARR
ncbi:MAG: hypothetical protein ACJ77E_11970 [Gaiellaceae bacterium]